MVHKVAVITSILVIMVCLLSIQCELTGQLMLRGKRSVNESNFTSNSGEFTSPNYPDNYPSNQDFYYYVTVKSGIFVKLEFTHFNVEDILDYVEIYDGLTSTNRQIGSYSGSTLPPVVISSTPSVCLYFHSDGLVEHQGFHVTYKAVNTSNEGRCGGSYYSNFGVITSPNYPMTYPSNQACYYFITMLDDPSRVQLNFTDFSTETYLDYVSVIDGPSKSGYELGKFSGLNVPIQVISTGPSMIVYFSSDSAVENTGFSATFYAVPPPAPIRRECGGTFTSTWGIVRSPYFPDDYLNSQICLYYIHASQHHVIQIQFTTVLTEECCDLIEIFDGDSTSGLSLGVFSGEYALPPVLTSSGPSMCVYFHTDSSVVRMGFEAFYTTRPVDGINVCDVHATTGLGGVIYSNLSYPGESPMQCYLNISSLFRYDMVYLRFIHVENCSDGDTIVVTSADGEQITLCDALNNETTINMTSSTIDISFVSYSGVMSQGFKAIYSLYYQEGTYGCIDDNDFRCNNGRCISRGVFVGGYDFCGDQSTPREKRSNAGVIAGATLGTIAFVVVLIGALYWVSRSTKGKRWFRRWCLENGFSDQLPVSLQSFNHSTRNHDDTTTTTTTTTTDTNRESDTNTTTVTENSSDRAARLVEILESAISDNRTRRHSAPTTVNTDIREDESEEDSFQPASNMGQRSRAYLHSEEAASNDTNDSTYNSSRRGNSILDAPPSYVDVVKTAVPPMTSNYDDDDDFEEDSSESSWADSSFEERGFTPTAPPLENDSDFVYSRTTDETSPPTYADVLRTTEAYL